MSAAETPRRPTGAELVREVAVAALSRVPRSATADIEVGMEARTKEWYVKSLHVPQGDGEDWNSWLHRLGAIAEVALLALPTPAVNGGTE